MVRPSPGAGIVGVAVGFGAQNLVRDFISGIFMLVEDQYGVGDIIDAGPASGTVEAVSLRTTRIRDVNGVVWQIPNGSIERIGNKSQQWSRALLDFEVAYDTDVDFAGDIIERAIVKAWDSDTWHDVILAEPEVWGVENLGADGVTIRVAVKTLPGKQFPGGPPLAGAGQGGIRGGGDRVPRPPAHCLASHRRWQASPGGLEWKATTSLPSTPLNRASRMPGGEAYRRQHADAFAMADVAAQALLVMQADAPPGRRAAELGRGRDVQYVVHQASGMVSVQLEVSVGRSVVRLWAYAFGNDRPLTEVAEDVWPEGLRFDDRSGERDPGPQGAAAA